ncbi:hypothetical protein [Parasutterella excrementihominis]|jgi:hypothetical protein|uniref:hypothetical protein n=1 Tax=Parasutterella excrementihominis TaxID=487175 RepID=UPI0012BD14CE|nr:hypothetical protein [Parasutterella excrementihominis]MTT64664.1 hypothetical protein [Parasutterella excrementihominis]MTT92985.1 hypothetical protein [Parasutterella excrementihominis]
MKDRVLAFVFLYVSLLIALVIAFSVSRLSGITNVNAFVLMTLVVWLIEFAAVIWILRRR